MWREDSTLLQERSTPSPEFCRGLSRPRFVLGRGLLSSQPWRLPTRLQQRQARPRIPQPPRRVHGCAWRLSTKIRMVTMAAAFTLLLPLLPRVRARRACRPHGPQAFASAGCRPVASRPRRNRSVARPPNDPASRWHVEGRSQAPKLPNSRPHLHLIDQLRGSVLERWAKGAAHRRVALFSGHDRGDAAPCAVARAERNPASRSALLVRSLRGEGRAGRAYSMAGGSASRRGQLRAFARRATHREDTERARARTLLVEHVGSNLRSACSDGSSRARAIAAEEPMTKSWTARFAPDFSARGDATPSSRTQ